MMAVTLIEMVAFVTFLKVLALNDGKKNERARPKDEQGDYLSRHVNLKLKHGFGMWPLSRCARMRSSNG
jgi:hypothetical protein